MKDKKTYARCALTNRTLHAQLQEKSVIIAESVVISVHNVLDESLQHIEAK